MIIENSKKVSLQKFIYSIGIRHIGIENAKLIADNVTNIEAFLKIIQKKQFNKFLNIDGIGETQVNSLSSFFENKLNLYILNDLKNILNIEKEILNKYGALKNKTFMITGKLIGISRAEVKSLIEKNSGTTLSSVNKNLNYLIVGDKPTTRKVDQAKSLGIEIISQDDLNNLLN